MAKRFLDALDDTEIRVLNGDGGWPSPLGKNAEQYRVGDLLRDTYQSLHGGGWGAISDELVAAGGGSTFVAQSGQLHPVNTVAGAATITPPSNPQPGDAFSVVDARASFGTNPCTIAVTGRLVNGAAAVADIVLSANGASAELIWLSDTIGWARIRS